MPLFAPRRVELPELLDEAGNDPQELKDNLADIRRVNRWLGGNAQLVQQTLRILHGKGNQGRCTMLDVATGSADLPLAMQQAAGRIGLRLQAYGSDRRPDVLAEAQRHSVGSVRLLCHDALHLPFNDGTFDVVTCSQTLHHFGETEALLVLRELQRVARQAVVVSDLHRSWRVYWGARLLALALRSPMSRHDGPLSARRAYTAAEVRQLLGQAGLRGHVRRAGPAHWVALIPGRAARWPHE